MRTHASTVQRRDSEPRLGTLNQIDYCSISGYRVNLAVTFVLDEYDDEILPAVPNPASQTADFA